MRCNCHAIQPFCPGLQVHAFWNIFFFRSDVQWSFSVTSAWPWNRPSVFRRCRALCNCWYPGPGAHECMRTCVQHCATIVVLVHFLASSTHLGLSNFEFFCTSGCGSVAHMWMRTYVQYCSSTHALLPLPASLRPWNSLGASRWC